MNKQLRILIGDIGDEFAATVASAFSENGEWAVARLQLHDKLISAVRQEHFDVLVLNQTVPTIHTSVLTEELIRNSELIILVLYREKELGLAKILTQQGVHYLPYPDSVSDLVAYIYRLCGVKIEEQTAKYKSNPDFAVTHLLHSYGISSNLHGFQCLRRAIVIAYEQNCQSGCMMKVIYPTVAKEYNSTPQRVERTIRHAIMQAWENSDRRIGLQFGFGNGHRMTNSEFIAFAVDWLRTEQSFQRFG